MSYSLMGEGGGDGGSSNARYSSDLWTSSSPLDGNGATGGMTAMNQQHLADAELKTQYAKAQKAQRDLAYSSTTQSQINNMYGAMVDPHVLQAGGASNQMPQHSNVPLDRQAFMRDDLYRDPQQPKQKVAGLNGGGGGGNGPNHGNVARAPPRGGTAPEASGVDMSSVRPDQFRKYMLYVQMKRKRLNPETNMIEDFTPDESSIVAIERIKPFEQEVWVQEVREIPKNERPPWMTVTPILVCMDTKKGYRGSQCLAQIEALRGEPMGVTGAGDGGEFGYTIDGSSVDPLDTFEVGVSDLKKYYSTDKNSAPWEAYDQARKERDSLYQQNKPTPARVKAIEEALKLSYTTQ